MTESDSEKPEAVGRVLLLAACLALASCRYETPTSALMADKFGDGQTRVLVDTDGTQFAVERRVGDLYSVRPILKTQP